MMVIDVVYWVILLLAIISFFVPEPYARYSRAVDLVLFVLIGVRTFPTNLH